MPQTGTPEMKARVPSIGSTIQVELAGRCLVVPLLADDAVVGEVAAMHVADGDLGVPVGGGDGVEAGRPFVVDGERRAEARQRPVGGRVGRLEHGRPHQIGVEAAQARLLLIRSAPNKIVSSGATP